MRFVDSVHAFIAVSVLVMALLLAVGGQWVTLGAYYKTAALTQSIAITAIEVSVTVQPSAVDYGLTPLGGSKVSPQITATNTGTQPEDFFIQGSDAIATVVGQSNWTLTLQQGVDLYMNGYGNLVGGPFSPLYTGPVCCVAQNVAAAGTKSFFLEVRAPTSTVGTGIRNSTVTVIAVLP